MSLENEDEFIKEVFKRSHKIWEEYQKNHKDNEKEYPYEVTATINSLLGTMVFAKEDNLLNYEQMNIDGLITKQKIIEENPTKEFIRHLRNAIAHGNLTPILKDKNIIAITFEDRKFKVTLSISELSDLIKELKKGVLGVENEHA